MLTVNLATEPRPANMVRLMKEIFRADPLIDECFPGNPVLARQLKGSGETFAPEFAHSPFACLDVACGRERCVALQERILSTYPLGFSVCCSVCRQTLSNAARLDCSACAA